MIGQPGDPGVATYVAQASSNGAIGYVEYSWALQEGFPVAKLLNAAGYYTLPSPGHVAVSLLQDKVDTADSSNPSKYLTQDLSGVYSNPDPRNYELSAYSYLILPTDTSNGMTNTKGYTIGIYGSYLLCLGQSQVDALGYSALPINLVQAGFTQLQKVPGSTVPAQSTAQIAQCNNPTFATDGTNTLANNDPQPLACDKQGSTQCAEGQAEPTETGVSQTVTSGTGGTTSTGGTSTGGTSTGGTSTGGTSTGGTSTGGTSTGGTSTSGTSTGGTKTSGGATSTGGAKVNNPTGGATSGSTGTTGTGQNCDPNTGVCSPAGGSTTGTGSTGSGGSGTGTTGNGEVGNGTGAVAGSGQSASDTPITLAGSNGSGLEVALMALAAGMMFLLSVVPPLLAQAGKRSRQRRGIDEFYEGNEWPGDRK
jgi:hypothetical protein